MDGSEDHVVTLPIEVSSEPQGMGTETTIFADEPNESVLERMVSKRIGASPPLRRAPSSSVQDIVRTAREISALLEVGFKDATIPFFQERGSSNVDWPGVLSKLDELEDIESKKYVLETKFQRNVTVYEDSRNPDSDDETKIHRRYVNPNDTVLNQILRREPPPHIKDALEEISIPYRWSRELHEILDKMEPFDNRWGTVDELLKEIVALENKLLRDIAVEIATIIQRDRERTDFSKVEPKMKQLEGKKTVAKEKASLEEIIERIKSGQLGNTGNDNDREWKVLNKKLERIKDKHAIDKAFSVTSVSSRLLIDKLGKAEVLLEEIESIFYIQHSWREDTLLMIASRRKPTLSVVEMMLHLGPNAKSIVDTPLYDWIPLRYTLNYAAHPAITKLLIPREHDHKFFSQEMDIDEATRFKIQGSEEDKQERRAQIFGFGVDVYGKNALHWTVVYDAPLETVRALVKEAGDFADELREMGDRQNNFPYEIAIEDGEGIGFIEQLIPSSMDINTIEFDLVTSIATRNQIYHPPEEIFADLAKSVAVKTPLQNILIRRGCEPIPTVVLMLDAYAAIFLIVSFRFCVEYYTAEGRDADSVTPGWWYPLLATTGFMLARELFQMTSRPESYFFVMWNYVELCVIGVVGAAAWLMQVEDIRHHNSLVVAASFFTWFNLIIFLRNTILSFSIFVNGMQKIFIGLVPFAVVSGIILLGFAEMFWAQSWLSGECAQPGTDEDAEKFCDYWDAFLTTLSFFYGGIDVREESVEDANYWGNLTLIAVLFGFVVAIILLNVVIAIVSELWEDVKGIGEEVYWTNRLEFFHDLLVYEKRLYAERKDPKDPSKFLEPRKSCLGYVLFAIEDFVSAVDDLIESRVLKPLWMRPDLWGYYMSIMDRMFSREYGSFRWQLAYDLKDASTARKKYAIMIKSGILVIVFGAILSVWFILGLATAGLLWSKALRRLILARGIQADPSKDDSEHETNE